MKRSLEERRALADRIYNKRLTPEEFEKRLAASRTPEQVAERRAKIDWFCRRYPTALERLRYITARSRSWLKKP